MKLLRCILCVALIITTMTPASAFKPKSVHLPITREALQQVTRVVDGRELRFSERAISQVMDANEATDSLTYSFYVSSRHFDNELFRESSTRLKTLREDIIKAITNPVPDGALAREKLGQAFHTLQDFYSHSNWVNLSLQQRDNRTIEDRLGTAILWKGQGGAPPIAHERIFTCPDSQNRTNSC